jgi:hypothetical protein
LAVFNVVNQIVIPPYIWKASVNAGQVEEITVRLIIIIIIIIIYLRANSTAQGPITK